MKRPYCILFREAKERQEELSFAKKYFSVYTSRTLIPAERQVIGRYSVLPFYKEVFEDVSNLDSSLITAFKEHNYIADFQYYEDVKHCTSKTYFNFNEIPNNGSFVVKGKTNSKKLEWSRKMFAKDKVTAIQIGLDLLQDGLIADQEIIFREFIDYIKIDEGLNGLPIINEWRFFFFEQEVIFYDFYWKNFTDKMGNINHDGLKFAKDVAEIISKKVKFFVLDIAQKLDGSWHLIEVNDGQCSGLNGIDPDKFYSNFRKILDKKEV